MILSDRDIVNELNKHQLKISPYYEEMIQPCSVDLHLASELLDIEGNTYELGEYTLNPKEFILASTFESVRIPPYLCGQVDGKSSLGRLGLFIHITAGYIDAGYEGNITLELFNASDKPIRLIQGMDIAQLVLYTLTSPVLRPYGSHGLNSKYQGSKGVVGSKYEYQS